MSNADILHIIGGHSAASSLKQALHIGDDQLLVFDDCLDSGPMVDFRTVEEWKDKRQHHWEILGIPRGERSTGLIRLGEADTDFIDILRGAQQVRVWLGSAIPEQMILTWLFKVYSIYRLDAARLSLIEAYEIDDPVYDRRILGTGELNPQQLQQFYQRAPRTLSNDDLSELGNAWTAITSATPKNLVDYCAQTVTRFPALIDGMRHLLLRYPDARTGLNITDRSMLSTAAKGKQKAAYIVGHAMADCMDRLDFQGDIYLFRRLVHLGDDSLAEPAVKLFGDTTTLRDTEVELTEAGKRFLSGDDNFVKRNGIDDWVGGVHLTSDNTWFFNPNTNSLQYTAVS